MLTRAIGFVLVLSLFVAFLLNRKWMQIPPFALATVLLVAPWLIWSSVHKHELGGYSNHIAGGHNNYIAWAASGYSWSTPLSNLQTLVGI
jgi:hypothetical protein